ncbi:hypothetical protein GCM10027053_20780 [Intrasporangium mesophilum]
MRDEPTGFVMARGVGFTYRGGRAALRDVSFTWPRGFTALLGPNGAGKSTLLSLVIGDRRPQRGDLKIAARSVGFVPQQADWPGQFTVREFLIYSSWLKGLPRKTWGDRVGTALASVALTRHADERLGRLSGGQHRRAMIAQALVSDPSVLVLDEPTTGLDPRQRIQLRTLLEGIATTKSVVVATHLVEDVESVADWLTILDGGRVVHDSSMREVEQQFTTRGSAVEAAYLELVDG